MNIHEFWEKALKRTEIIRPRIQSLQTFGTTHLPYIFLAESALNVGDSVVRRGEVLVDKPNLILPPATPQFEGFGFEKDMSTAGNDLTTFLLVRGVRFPSLKYENKTSALDIYEGRLQKAIDHYKHDLQKEENISTGLIIGPEDVWQFSIMIFICSQVLKSTDGDIKNILDKYKEKGNG